MTTNKIKEQLEYKFPTSLESLDVQVAVKDIRPSVFGEFNVTERILQVNEDLLIIYDMVVSVRTTIKFNQQNMQDYVSETFGTSDKKYEYILALQDSGDSSFNTINDVAVSIDGTTIVLTSPVPTDGGKGITFYAPIVAGSAAAVLLLIYCTWRRKASPSDKSAQSPMSFLNQADFESMRTPADRRIESTIEVDAEEATMSTLGNPIPANPVFGAFGGVSTTDSQSASTNPGFDFNRAYGGAVEENSISVAAGRKSAESPGFLRNSGNTLTSEVSSSNQSSVNQSEISLFTDDESFERMYGGDVVCNDKTIEVRAPAGKLGVVIDTPLSGIPIVHAIKDTSVLADKVNIGDKLLSVDGEDTTEMSAIKVSKLISSKQYHERILVFARPQTEAEMEAEGR